MVIRVDLFVRGARWSFRYERRSGGACLRLAPPRTFSVELGDADGFFGGRGELTGGGLVERIPIHRCYQL